MSKYGFFDKNHTLKTDLNTLCQKAHGVLTYAFLSEISLEFNIMKSKV